MLHIPSLSQPKRPQAGTPLSRGHFRKVSENGFGDGFNAYAHSMCWFNGHIYCGTSRATMVLLGAGDGGGMKDVSLDAWPVELSDRVYSRTFENRAARAEIWRMDPRDMVWERVYQAPLIKGRDGTTMSRDLGYRAMVVYQGDSDEAPVLYTSTWSRSRGYGLEILRSEDGRSFTPVGEPGLGGLDSTSTRSLVVFKGKLFTSPTGATAGRQNASGLCNVLMTTDPVHSPWQECNTSGFGDPNNLGVFEMLATDEYLYAGTANMAAGYQLWRTRAEGPLPYHWERVLTDGGGRGRLNQAVVSLGALGEQVFVGSGIQKGGIDKQNKVGPAGPELIRLNPNGSHDVVMGERRQPHAPLSGMLPGWNNIFCGSIWKQQVHDGWLYAGTQDWLVFLLYRDFNKLQTPAARFLREMDLEEFVETHGGYDLWRSQDGEHWVPVTRSGFENPYNHGVRNIVSTPHGVFIGSSNQFGPRSAFRIGPSDWIYRDNPRGGTEIWLGSAN